MAENALRVATHNVLELLSEEAAAESVAAILAHLPHLVGLQEWGRGRRSILRTFGAVTLFPRLRLKTPTDGYLFAYPLGGQPVGIDLAWAELVSVRRINLSRARKDVRATYGTEVIVRTREGRETIALLNLHLIAHHNRPRNESAWFEGVASVERWAEGWHGYTRFVVGDVNKQGLRIGGLKSCWDGRRAEPTFKGRTIDEIYGVERAADVEVIDTRSDHHAVIATYPQPTEEK